MGLTTIKIDRELHERIKRILSRPDLKYKYPSVAGFANQAISRKLESLKNARLDLKW